MAVRIRNPSAVVLKRASSRDMCCTRHRPRDWKNAASRSRIRDVRRGGTDGSVSWLIGLECCSEGPSDCDDCCSSLRVLDMDRRCTVVSSYAGGGGTLWIFSLSFWWADGRLATLSVPANSSLSVGVGNNGSRRVDDSPSVSSRGSPWQRMLIFLKNNWSSMFLGTTALWGLSLEMSCWYLLGWQLSLFLWLFRRGLRTKHNLTPKREHFWRYYS